MGQDDKIARDEPTRRQGDYVWGRGWALVKGYGGRVEHESGWYYYIDNHGCLRTYGEQPGPALEWGTPPAPPVALIAELIARWETGRP